MTNFPNLSDFNDDPMRYADRVNRLHAELGEAVADAEGELQRIKSALRSADAQNGLLLRRISDLEQQLRIRSKHENPKHIR